MGRPEIDALASWIMERDDFALIGHVFPDGDTTGCCMAAWLALRALGKRAFVCLPGGCPSLYARYPGADEILTPEDTLPFAPKTALALDVSDEGRLGAARPLFERCEARAVLDHHGTNPGFGQINVIDASCAATGELVLELIDALGVLLASDTALWLMIALSTDSGHFTFSNTTPRTLMAAAKLLEAGVNMAAMARDLYRTRSKARTHLLGLVLSKLRVSEDGTMAWARLTDAMLREAGASPEDNEGIVNYLLEIEGVEFAALAEERPGGTKFSLRSKGALDVARSVASPLGGGGHALAAGCTLALPMEEALTKVLETARAAMNTRETE